jgi:hypothetical protein
MYNLAGESSGQKGLMNLKPPLVGKDVIVELHVPAETGSTSRLIYKGQYTDVSRYHNSRVVEYVETGYSAPLNISTSFSFGGTLAKGDTDDILSQIAFGTTKLTRNGGRIGNTDAATANTTDSTPGLILGSDKNKLDDSVAGASGATAADDYIRWSRQSTSSAMTNPYIMKIFKAYSTGGSINTNDPNSNSASGGRAGGANGSGDSVDYNNAQGRVHIYEEVNFSNFRAVSNAGSDIATHVLDWYATGWEIQELI